MATLPFINRQLFRGLIALILVLSGFLWIGQQERMLWHAAPVDNLDRYALDRLLPPLPPRVNEATLWQLCNEESWIPRIWHSRHALAACLDEEPAESDMHREPLHQLAAVWRESIRSQLAVADKVAGLTSTEVLAELTKLRQLRYRLQRESGGPILHGIENVHLARAQESKVQEEFLPADEDADAIIKSLRLSRQNTAAQLAEIDRAFAASTDFRTTWRISRDLGLLATGMFFDHDNANIEPTPTLRSARTTLAEQLEWLRRAQPRAGEPLEKTLFGYLPMMFASTLLAVTIAALMGCFPLATALLMLLATVGGFQLLDLSVTGPSALRHLTTRDFSEGLWHWQIPGSGIALWGPALAFIVSLTVGRLIAKNSRLAGWVSYFVRIPGGWHTLGIVLATVLLIVVIPGIAALKAELLVLLGSIPIALFIARHAPLIAQGANEWSLAGYTAPLLVAAFFSSFLGSGLRGDFGAFGIAFIVLALFAVLIANGWPLRLLLLGGLLAGGAWYFHFMDTGRDATGFIHLLPEHGQLRFLLAQDATHHGAPDLKQVEWFIRHATNGYGPGNIPWAGLPGNDNAYGLPLPAASDLSLVLPAAMGGMFRAYLELGLLCAVLVLAISYGFCRAAGKEVRIGERFAAALGAFGLLVVLLRALLSAGGTLQVVPLTGVPIALISHAPTTAMMTLLYAGLVFGICGGKTMNDSLKTEKL